jgi:hypothetical protein
MMRVKPVKVNDTVWLVGIGYFPLIEGLWYGAVPRLGRLTPKEGRP